MQIVSTEKYGYVTSQGLEILGERLVLPLLRDNTNLLTVIAFAAVAHCEFTCIKPVNPIPVGFPGLCCKVLTQDILLTFLYTGENCMSLRHFYCFSIS